MTNTRLPDFRTPNLLLDFGPPLRYESVCTAYTVAQISLWEHQPDDNNIELLAFNASGLPRARAEGTLYRLNDDEMFSLDKMRGVGYNCTRKEHLPVIVPFNDETGAFHRTYANMYMADSDFWSDRLTFGTRVPKEPTFRLAQTITDQDPMLSGRFSFLQYPRPKPILRTPRPEVINAVVLSNREALRRIRWDNFKKRFYSFLND